MGEPTLTPWPLAEPPNEQALERIFKGEGLSPRWWSNGPGDRMENRRMRRTPLS